MKILNIEKDKIIKDPRELQKFDNQSLIDYFEGRIMDGAGTSCYDIIWVRKELLDRME